MPKLHKQTVLPADAPRLDLVVQTLTGAPRAVIRGLFDHGCVTLDGQPCSEPGLHAPRGAVVAVSYDPAQRYKAVPRARLSRKFRIAFEDEHLIVVEKVAGILTVPTDRGEQDTLLHEVARYFSKGPHITRKAFIVHRLDRDTSGLLVFAKRQEVADALRNQFEARKPGREYAALVAGQVREDQGTFRSYLATADDLDQYSTQVPGQGKLAVTHFRVMQRLRGATFVRVTLETGRRNQIRVHFAEAGHPVLGDVRYEVERARHPAWREKRLALHAQTLAFTHPVTGRPVRATSELPEVFVRFLAADRAPQRG